MKFVARNQGKPASSKLRTKSERGSTKQSAAEVMDLLKRGKLSGEKFCEVTNHLPPSERKELLDQLLRELRDLEKASEVDSSSNSEHHLLIGA